MKELAEQIIIKFQEKEITIFNNAEFVYNLESIQLYLAAVKYIERYE